MEKQEQLNDDMMAIVTVEPTPMLSNTTIDDGNGEAADPETSCISPSACNVTCASTPSKKAVDRELRQPFPVKVYEMLENADQKLFSHIVSWNATGTGFMVHDKDHFTKEIVPHYFNLTKYKSFQRQVSPKPIAILAFSISDGDYSQLELYLQYFPTCTYIVVVPIWLPTSDCGSK